jgi:hypothetical protein
LPENTPDAVVMNQTGKGVAIRWKNIFIMKTSEKAMTANYLILPKELKENQIARK